MPSLSARWTVLLLGGVAASRIATDILPIFTTPAVQVLTLYPGMPAQVMEKRHHEPPGALDRPGERHRAPGGAVE